MLYLAWRNMVRRLGQSAITAFIIVIVTCVVTTSLMVASSLEQGVSLARERLGADVMVLPVGASSNAQEVLFTAQPVNVYLPSSVCEAVATVPGVAQTTPQFFTQTVNESCCSVVGATRIVGIDANTDFILRPWLQSGDAANLGGDGIVAGARAPAFEGERASILGSTFQVVGTLEETGTSVDETIFMDIDAARTTASASPYLEGVWEGKDPFTSISCVMVKTAPGTDAAQVAKDVMAACPGTVAVVASEMVAGVSSQLSAIAALFAALLVALVVVAALALAGRFSALMASRMAEWGLMRTMGVRVRDVTVCMICEVGIIALVGALVGTLAACLMSVAALDFLHEAFAMPGAPLSAGAYAAVVAIGMGFAIGLSALAVVYPVAKIIRRDPQETLARGDL